MQKYATEDVVRFMASEKLELNIKHEDVKSGSGQITTFNQLGFKGINDKPDGWYLPNNVNNVAIILETKSSKAILNGKSVDELLKNINIISSKYKKIIGILYNLNEIKVFKNLNEVQTTNELEDLEYYLSLYKNHKIDKQHIFDLTSRINNSLHFTFGIKDLYHRMIFTACALVAKRYGALLIEGMDYSAFQNAIQSTISKALIKDKKQNQKLEILLDVFSEIKMNLNISTEDEKEQKEIKDAIANFISWIGEIADAVNSDIWNGEDVMGIFFNEFNRYKSKSENGQVFTPEHVTDFMYKISEVSKNDRVLDAAAGSGGFLVKSMANMIKEAGGQNTEKAKHIKAKQLFGIEFDRQIFALACANMLIHKDGKTNLEQLDSRNPEAGEWIKSKNITKVLMNPPYEHKYGPIEIMENVMENVNIGSICTFILPDKKLEKESRGRKLLEEHTLKKIIKMPENLFFGVGIKTSIFVFEAQRPHGNKSIFTCYMKEDGLETVKNKGRQDTSGKWADIERHWIEVVDKQSGDESVKWISPSESLSYHEDIPEFFLSTKNINKTVLDYAAYKLDTSMKKIELNIANNILFDSEISVIEEQVLKLSKNSKTEAVNVDNWKLFDLKHLFDVSGSHTTPKGQLNLEIGGPYPYVTTAATNNGISGMSEVFTEKGNLITVDSATDGIAFYQEKPFVASDHVEELHPKFELTQNIALFIITVLNINAKRYKYGYDEKRSQTALRKEKILLPSKEGVPDWSYMNKMIENSPYYSLVK
ncbi:N-6 DNA methylase [Leuconostoc falkenbergense]